MSTLFAFLHHLMAFTLVAAIAIEFVLIRQEITRANALRLLVTDAVLGASATVLLIVGLLRVFYFEKGATYYFSSHAFLTKFVGVHPGGDHVGGADHRIPVMAQGGAGRAGADGERQEAQDRPLDPALRADRRSSSSSPPRR